MIILNSARLKLWPLTAEQLNTFSLSGRNRMEESLGLAPTDFKVNAPASFIEELERALQEYIIPNVTAYPEETLWYTHWLIVETATKITVGGIGAAGPPDADGQVMIGYYIEKSSEGKGYATEAVQCFTQWIFSNPKAKYIVADTLVSGIGSQKVLQKAGFTRNHR